MSADFPDLSEHRPGRRPATWLLCALNLDRGKQLPRNRMGLYAAALELLLERRDAERGIAAEVTLESEQKVRVLQDLAWQLTVWGRSELSRATALRRVEEKLRTMPRVDASARAVLEHLLQRSGVIREPVPGRIDFVHRTVQEYLAAKQAADDADVEPLVERAHLDQWRETVVMAAGHANAPVRRELLRGLLDRIDEGGRHGRRLRLLVAGCLETIQELPGDLRDRVEECLAVVIPPRNAAEARVLALAGEEVLRRLPGDLAGLSTARAVATVRTCWLINGADALRRLAGYRDDPRWDVQRELVTGWDYFDPDRYAAEVLADAPLTYGSLYLENRRHLRSLHRLGHLEGVGVEMLVLEDLDFLRGVRPLQWLSLNSLGEVDLDEVASQRELRNLSLRLERRRHVDLGFLTRLPRLQELTLGNVDFGGDVAFLDSLPRLERLTLNSMESVRDFGPVARQTGLRSLFLFGAVHLSDGAFFAAFPRLRHVSLGDADLRGGLAALVGHCPRLRSLRLYNLSVGDLGALSGLHLTSLGLTECRRVTDLAPLAGQRDLETLVLMDSAVSDLAPLAGLPKLDGLFLNGSRRVTDLSPLATVDTLRHIDLRNTAATLDLAPLAGKPGLSVTADPGQELRNTHLLHRTAKVQRM